MGIYDEEIAWAAGLFEGEGTITQNSGVVNLRVTSTDGDVLDRFAEVVGAGKVYGSYVYTRPDGCKRKPFYVWVCQGSAIEDVVRMLVIWLSPRRLKQAQDHGLSPWNRL
jgi:hypothetical protein